MKLFRRNKGLISVFLTIILVPIITVTSLFVDASRMMLAKSVVNSAGDLALNTMMTHYDSKLNDFYGLMASAQDIDDFKEQVKTYFKNSMESKGVAGNDIQYVINMADDLMNHSVDYSDLLQISLDGNDAFQAGTVSNSGLDNPAVLKTQIVNFMKYRAPMDAVSELLDKFKKIADATENTSQDAELLSAKEDAAQKQGEAMNSLEQLWEDCKNYNEAIKAWDGKDDKRQNFKKLYKFLGEDCKSKYNQIHEYVVCNVLYAPDANDISNMDITQKQYKIQDFSNNSSKKASASDISRAFTELVKACLAYYSNDAATQVEKIVKEYDTSKQNDATKYAAYCKKITEPYKQFVNDVNEVQKCYANLTQALAHPKDGIDINKDKLKIQYQENQVSKEKEGTYSELKKFIETEWTDAIKKSWDPSGTAYRKMQNNTEKYKVSKKKLKEKIKEVKKNGNEMISQVKDTLQAYENGLKNAQTQLENASTHLSDLQIKMRDFKAAQEKREQLAQSLKDKSDVAKADCEGMENSEDGEGKEIKDLCKSVSVENIAAFRERLVFLADKCQKLQKAVKSMKYGTTKKSKKLTDIDSVDDIESILEASGLFSKEEVQKATVDELRNKAADTFKDVYCGPDMNMRDTSWIDSEATAPALEYKKGHRSTVLYHYMKDKFKDSKGDRDNGKKRYDEKKNKKDKQVDDAKDETEEAEVAEEFKTSNKEIAGVSALPSKTWKNGTIQGAASGEAQDKNSKKDMTLSSASDSLKKTFGGSVLQAVKNAVSSVRDDLYAMDYIFNMFSCDTTVREALYDIAEDSAKKDNKTMPTSIISVAEEEKKAIPTFNNTDITNKYNHTMTNKLLNNENNLSMGSEIEYILYGGNVKSNKEKAWGSIFVIRFVLNAIYGFSSLYSYEPKHVNDAKLVSGTATAISAATDGVVPVALVKLAIILAIVVAETIADEAAMKMGMPVALIKSEDDWKISYSSIFPEDNNSSGSSSSGSSGGSGTGHSSLKMRYSDYLKLFLLIEMIGDHEDVVYLRTADVIQANCGMREEGFLMSKAKTWFHIQAKTKVTPLMLNLDINRGTLNQSGISQDRLTGAWTKYHYEMSMGYY